LKRKITKVLGVLTKKERKTFWLQCAGDVMVCLCDIVFLALLVVILASVSGGNTILRTYLPIGAWNEKPLLLLGIFLLAYAVKNFLAWLLLKKQFEYYYTVAGRLSAENLESYLHSDYHDFVNTDSSVYKRKIAQQPVEFAHYVLRAVQTTISQSVLLLITIAALIIYDALLFTWLITALLPPLALVLCITRMKETSITNDIKTFSERSLQYLNEALNGFVENKVYAKTNFFRNRYSKYQDKLNHVLAGRQVLQGSSSRIMEVFVLLGMFVLLLAVNNGLLFISAFTAGAFIGAAWKLLPGCIKIIHNLGQLKAYSFTIDSVKLPSLSNADNRNSESGSIRRITFNEVGFSYGEKQLFYDLQFTLNAGDLAGMKGYSGKGKTTLVNMILGFVRPTSGTILINDKPHDPTVWLERISYVKQQPFILNDSAEKNITLSDENIDEDKFDLAYRKARLYLHPSVSLIKEHGKNISGGQRQRVALARALYKDFDLLILDEAFSEIDQEGEFELLMELKELAAAGKMIILITHNCQALSWCNKIISLDE
jgi:ABC-type multidrug transport system fused ATPase/permease subunit